jgi:DNA-binding LytR/AlgR family response regulator
MRIDVRDIDWVEAERDYLRIHAAGRSHLIRHRMHELEKELDPQAFLRVHRSAIVNVNRIGCVTRTRSGGLEVSTTSGDKVPVGASHRSALAALIDRR